MKLTLLAVLAPLLGVCLGLQPGLEYRYQYTGTVDTWLPADPTQYTGAALRATVAIRLTGAGDVLIKVSHAEVTERNTKSNCDAHSHTDLEYRDLDQAAADDLYKPFLVHANASEHSYLDVPHEPVWITNIRRGIVNTLPLATLTGQQTFRSNLKIKEDTIIGLCDNRYSFSKLTPYLAALENIKLEQSIEVDAQREITSDRLTSGTKTTGTKAKGTKRRGTKVPGKTHGSKRPGGSTRPARLTAPPISDTLTQITRILVAESCPDNHFTVMINGNRESRERVLQNSVATFLVRGEDSVFRLERAEVKGTIEVFTGDINEEHISTLSNQVLTLVAVAPLETQEPFSIEYEPERRPIYFQVQDAVQRSSLEEKLTGVPLTDPQATQAKEKIVEYLTTLTALLGEPGHQKPAFLETYTRLVDVVAILNRAEIEEALGKVPTTPEQHGLMMHSFHQALLASRTDVALEYLLERMKNRLFRLDNSLLTFQLFEGAVTSLRNPTFLPAILEVLKEMGQDEELMNVVSIIKFTELVNNICIDSNIDFCEGTHTCDPSFITNDLIPYLKQGVQESSKWRQIGYLQAMCNLGTPETLPTLLPIIMGTSGEDVLLRINAIYCLNSNFMPDTVGRTAFDILMSVWENPSEYPEVRSVAFLILTTWEPSVTWWQHMATSTWTENSTQVASYVSTTITALGNSVHLRKTGETSKYSGGSDNAAKVMHLVKQPQTDPSLIQSTYAYLEEVLHNCQVGTNVKFAWLASSKDLFPRAAFYRLKLSGVMGRTAVHTGALFRSGSQVSTLIERFLGRSFKRGEEAYEMVNEILADLKDDLSFQPPETEEAFLLLALVDFLEPFVMQAPGSGPPPPRPHYILVSHINNSPLHFRPADITLALPSSLGLPLVIRHDVDIFVRFKFGTSPERRGFGIWFSIDVSRDNKVEAKSLVPWSGGRTVGATVSNSIQLHAPFRFQFEDLRSSLRVKVRPLTDEPVRLVSWSNVMYTSLRHLHRATEPVIPSIHSVVVASEYGSPVVTECCRVVQDVVRRHGQHHRNVKNVFDAEVGLNLTASWVGDFEKPRNVETFFKELSIMHLKYNNWAYSLLLDPQSSRSKEVTILILTEYAKKEVQHAEDREDFEQFGDDTQGPADYDYSQMGQTIGGGGLEQDSELFGEQEFGQQEQVFSQVLTSHVADMQEQLLPPTGGEAITLAIGVDLQGAPRKYEFALSFQHSFARPRNDEKFTNRIHVAYFDTPQSGFIAESFLTCFDIEVERPYLPLLVPNELALQTDLKTAIHMKMYNGENCDGPPTLRIEGRVEVGPKALECVRSQLARERCDDHPEYSVKHFPIYDHVHVEATWTQDLLKSLKDNALRIDDLLQHYYFDQSIVDHSVVPPEDYHLIINGVKNLKTKKWTVTLSEPREEITFFNLSVPHLPNLVIAPESLYETPELSFIHIENDAKCTIEDHSVRTYDGLVYSFEPSTCWVTAAIHISDERYYPYQVAQAAVQVRFVGQWEARIIWPYGGAILDLSKDEVRLNEEPFTGHSDKFALHRLPDDSVVAQVGFVAVRVADKVEIMVSEVFRARVSGVCGNFDGEQINDMVGPEGCLYTDSALLTAAWSTRSDDCSRFHLRDKKRGLAEYRADCPKEVYQPTGISQHIAGEICTQWTRPVVGSGLNGNHVITCRARSLYPLCPDGCETHFSLTHQVVYDCVKRSPTGERIGKCFTKTEALELEASCSYQ